MKSIEEASVEYVQSCMDEFFPDILKDNILTNVEWFESKDPEYVYPVLVVEPNSKKNKNNLVYLCPPFNKSDFN